MQNNDTRMNIKEDHFTKKSKINVTKIHFYSEEQLVN